MVLSSDKQVKEGEGQRVPTVLKSYLCNFKNVNMYKTYMKQTWEKSPFLGRLRLEKSRSENPGYTSMCTSVGVVVVLSLKWYCLEE